MSGYDDIQGKIAELKSSVAKTIADLHLMERKADRLREEAEEWRSKAISALKAGDEDLAREALRKRQVLLEMEEDYRKRINEYHLNVMELKDDLRRLETKVKLMKFRPSTGVIEVPPAFEEYDRIVSRIEELEMQVEAMMEVKGG
jgi:phage shock protein A